MAQTDAERSRAYRARKRVARERHARAASEQTVDKVGRHLIDHGLVSGGYEAGRRVVREVLRLAGVDVTPVTGSAELVERLP